MYYVFDKDDWDANRYEAAFEKARQYNDMTAIWANECFEIWYLLHFEYRNTSIDRSELYKTVKERFGSKYSKKDATIYQQLLSKQKNALKNADRLLRQAKRDHQNFPWRMNPSTNIHELVQQLNRLCEL